ncbi:hypothetical protein [Bacillus sp. 03113]|uniref:hypothetical protein n=1 Tax=Bacillus sp. 03113 TaxID=2578211 RepID=UPI0011442896|nr:hypothetical protein [Bacillus sp. 03113]
MKRLVYSFIILVVLYAIYFDLKSGTLPAANDKAIEVSTQEVEQIPFFQKKVEPGETVLTIVEENIRKPLPVSISRVINDFKSLNQGTNPEEIKSSEIYKFPKYK